MPRNIIDTEFYKSLKNLEQSVQAFVYLAENTAIDESDYSIKNLLAQRLKADFHSMYVESIKLLPVDS